MAATPSRPRHPKKDVEAVVRDAERRGWRVDAPRRGHVWGLLWCPHRARDGYRVAVHSTPKDTGAHGRRLRRELDACPHGAAAADASNASGGTR